METHIQKRIWDRVQVNRITGGEFKANSQRLDRVLSLVSKISTRDHSDIKVLNIGIGNAYMESQFLDQGFDIYTLDPSESAIKAIQEKLPLDDDHAKCGWSQENPYPDNYFDFIIMSEVVEHLSDDILDQTFKEVQRVLIDGGYLIGTVPDNEDLSRNQFTCPYCRKMSHRVGHERSFTKQSLHELLKDYFYIDKLFSFRGMYLNFAGICYFHWIDFPFKVVRLFRSNVQSPHQISFNIMFVVRNTLGP